VNPYEVQYRIVKAVKLADMAERLGFTPDELESEQNLVTWADSCGVNKPSKETWGMVVSLLKFRQEYEGPGGIDHPRFIQHMGSMAVQIADTLAKHDVDSDEAERLSKTEKRQVAKMSDADQKESTFDLGKIFLEMRERFRLENI
tara:strand:+ start:1828 stop:2262 length:435 start_codon:yes stop_codon:yes gene_type:complete